MAPPRAPQAGVETAILFQTERFAAWSGLGRSGAVRSSLAERDRAMRRRFAAAARGAGSTYAVPMGVAIPRPRTASQAPSAAGDEVPSSTWRTDKADGGMAGLRRPSTRRGAPFVVRKPLVGAGVRAFVDSIHSGRPNLKPQSDCRSDCFGGRFNAIRDPQDPRP